MGKSMLPFCSQSLAARTKEKDAVNITQSIELWRKAQFLIALLTLRRDFAL